ncbi:MAG TPA: thioredoxin domain-containing protein [Polyangiaceae bacterium]|nr:thioredoxin domain-containing protein [Polyangiaceae bacterium]
MLQSGVAGPRPRSSFLVLLVVLLFGCAGAKEPAARAPVDTTSAENTSLPVAVSVRSEARPEQAQAKVPVTPEDPQWGSVDAPVTIVEFSDFQCPFCSRVVPTLEALKAKYGPSQLRIVFKHNPLPFHEQARPAAEAAAAVFALAGNQAFFAFHDLVFDNQESLSESNLVTWAASVGVQPEPLKAFLQTGRPAQKVDDDMALARRVGANGTPGFRINGATLSGAQPLEAFVQAVDAQLAAARVLTQTGTPPRLVYSTLTDRNVELAPPAKDRDIEPAAPDTHVWNIPVLADDPVRGSADALVTLVMFSDFQCPFCKRVEATLDELRKLYGKDLRIVWKDNPLPFHQRALPAATLARAVLQTKGNDAFWKMHDALFENQASLEDDDLEELIKKQGLNKAALDAAAKSPKISAKLQASQQLADDFEARGTPHFFINGRRLSGAQPLDKFKALIEEQLTKAKGLAEKGTPRAKLYAELMKTAEDPPPPPTKHVDLPPNAPSRGDAKAPVVIQEFSDFQCPFCKRVEPTLAQLQTELKGQIRIVWRHYPLPFHQYAREAAEAAEEVRAQKGDAAFWQYHDWLYAAQAEPEGLSRVGLDALADKLGLDLSRFKAALDGHVHAAKIDADMAAAAHAEIDGTPTFLIDDYVVSGAQPVPVFRRIIARAIADHKK